MNEQKLSAKEIEEIAKLKIEIKALKIKTYFDIAKAVALIIGSVILFWVIQRPESIINQKSSKETISRERAKLILDLIKEDDPQKLSLGLSIIEASYPETEEEWFKKLKTTFETKSNIKVVNELTNRYNDLLIKREKAADVYKKEISGNGGGIAGVGPIARFLKIELERIEYEIDQVENLLKSYGVKNFDTNEK